MNKNTASFLLYVCVGISLTVCQKADKLTTPSWIKVARNEGMPVRAFPSSESTNIGVIYPKYSYDIQDAIPTYCRILLENGQIGWIYSDPEAQKIKKEGRNKIRITSKNGVNARKEPKTESPYVGTALQGKTYIVKDVIYTWIQIKYEESKTGWVYIGRPEDRWVEIIE